jgi:hypothetical protein
MAYTAPSPGRGDRRLNSTNYEHPQETNLLNVHRAMQYNVLGEPILRTTLGPTATDAFGRFRTSQPFTLFDNSSKYADNVDGFVNFTASGGTTLHNANSSALAMTVDGTDGSKVYRESTRVFAYQPGKSLLTLESFCMAAGRAGLRQRVGYFDADNGFYLEQDGTDVYFVRRSTSSGSLETTRIAKSNWNISRLDGTDADKIVLDLATSQILYINMEWLGVGSVTMGFVINGQFLPCHRWDHANTTGATTTYMGTARLPLRYEIENTSATGVSDTLKFICQSVISEGGYELVGRARAIGHSIVTPRATSQAQVNTTVPMISIRLKAGRPNAVVIPTNFSFAPLTGANYQYFIIQQAVTAGGTWEDTGATSSVEYNLTPTSYTNGRIIDEGYVIATNQASIAPSLEGFPFKFQLERNTFTGVNYEFVIAVLTTTNITNQCWAIGWDEL